MEEEQLSEIEAYWIKKEKWIFVILICPFSLYLVLMGLILRNFDITFLIKNQEMGIETAQFFASTIFQSLAALFGLIFISFFFAYERLERRHEENRKVIPYYCAALSNSFKLPIIRYGISDQGRLFMLLINCESKLKEDFNRLISDWDNSTKSPVKNDNMYSNLIERGDILKKELMDFIESLEFFNRFKSIGFSMINTISIFFQMLATLIFPIIYSMSYLYSLDSMPVTDIAKNMFVIFQMTFIGMIWLILLTIIMIVISITKSLTRPETSPGFSNEKVLKPMVVLLEIIQKKEFEYNSSQTRKNGIDAD